MFAFTPRFAATAVISSLWWLLIINQTKLSPSSSSAPPRTNLLFANAELIRRTGDSSRSANQGKRRNAALENRLPAGLLESFRSGALLLEGSGTLVEITDGTFRFGGGGGPKFDLSDDDDLVEYDAFTDKSKSSKVFKSRRKPDKEDRVLILKGKNGSLKKATKLTGRHGFQNVQMEHIYEDIYLEYDTNDIDQAAASQFFYGEGDSIDISDSTSRLLLQEGLSKQQVSLLADQGVLVDAISDSTTRLLQSESSSCTQLKVLRVAMRYDSGFCAMYNDDANEAEDEIAFLVATISEWYEINGLCFKIEICDIEGYCNGAAGTDRFRDMISSSAGVCGAYSDDTMLLTKFTHDTYPLVDDNNNDIPFWERFPGSLPEGQCDTAHLLYGKNENGNQPFATNIIGCAFRPATCNYAATGVDYIGFTTNFDLQATLLAHELGHNFNASHVSDPNNEGFIMVPYVCPCDVFDDASKAHMFSYIDSISSATCTATIDVDPPTEYPSSAPSHTPTITPQTPAPTQFPSSSPSFTPSSTPTKQPCGQTGPLRTVRYEYKKTSR